MSPYTHTNHYVGFLLFLGGCPQAVKVPANLCEDQKLWNACWILSCQNVGKDRIVNVLRHFIMSITSQFLRPQIWSLWYFLIVIIVEFQLLKRVYGNFLVSAEAGKCFCFAEEHVYVSQSSTDNCSACQEYRQFVVTHLFFWYNPGSESSALTRCGSSSQATTCPSSMTLMRYQPTRTKSSTRRACSRGTASPPSLRSTLSSRKRAKRESRGPWSTTEMTSPCKWRGILRIWWIGLLLWS